MKQSFHSLIFIHNTLTLWTHNASLQAPSFGVLITINVPHQKQARNCVCVYITHSKTQDTRIRRTHSKRGWAGCLFARGWAQWDDALYGCFDTSRSGADPGSKQTADVKNRGGNECQRDLEHASGWMLGEVRHYRTMFNRRYPTTEAGDATGFPRGDSDNRRRDLASARAAGRGLWQLQIRVDQYWRFARGAWRQPISCLGRHQDWKAYAYFPSSNNLPGNERCWQENLVFVGWNYGDF